MQNLVILKLARWHFITVPKSILNSWGNFLIFNFEHFSIAGLAKSLLSHWRKDETPYERGFNPKAWLFTFLNNMISRILGAIARTIVICFGLAVEVLILAIGLIIFLIWFFLPLILLSFFLYCVGVLT